MKYKKNISTNSNIGRGPIAKTIIALAHQSLNAKIAKISDLRKGAAEADRLQKTVVSIEGLKGYDPAHGLYTYAQNQLSVFIEIFVNLPAVEKLAELYIKAEDEYLPSGSPNSPLSKSYFFCWANFDLISNQSTKETLTTIAIDLYRSLGYDEEIIALFEKMQNSRMGIYRFVRTSGKFSYLKELITNKELKVVVTSGFVGSKDEIWYVRIFPPPVDDVQFDYSVVFTTPYVIGKNGIGNEFIIQVENDWLAFFERNLAKTNIKDKVQAYEYFMRYGLSRNYWNEYVFLAYRNFTPNVIFLEGIPDKKSSLPHA